MSSGSIGAITGGLALTVAAGVCNGSWNAAFNPKFAVAVGPRNHPKVEPYGRNSMLATLSRSIANLKSERTYDLDFHYAWMLFQIYAFIINFVLCLLWAGGPSNVYFILSNTSTKSIVLVIVFSFLWGIGSVLFGLACKVAGIGLGTNLTMCIILVIGTLIPLIYNGQIATFTGGVIVAGLSIVTAGLYFSYRSMVIRDLEFLMLSLEQRDSSSRSNARSIGGRQGRNDANSLEDSTDRELKPFRFSGEWQRRYDADSPENSNENTVNFSSEDERPVPSSSLNCVNILLSVIASPDTNNLPVEPEHSSLMKMGLCVLCGLFATQLQFAFIFGQEMIDLAKSSGNTPYGGSTAIIWLFSVPIGCIQSIAFCLYCSPKEIPLKTLWLCPWWRHLLIIISTSIPWLAQMHLYGLATVVLPQDFALSVAWPILYATTIGQASIMSLFLGEWAGSSNDVLYKLRVGLSLTAAGVCVFMSSLAVSVN